MFKSNVGDEIFGSIDDSGLKARPGCPVLENSSAVDYLYSLAFLIIGGLTRSAVIAGPGTSASAGRQYTRF